MAQTLCASQYARFDLCGRRDWSGISRGKNFGLLQNQLDGLFLEIEMAELFPTR